MCWCIITHQCWELVSYQAKVKMELLRPIRLDDTCSTKASIDTRKSVQNTRWTNVASSSSDTMSDNRTLILILAIIFLFAVTRKSSVDVLWYHSPVDSHFEGLHIHLIMRKVKDFAFNKQYCETRLFQLKLYAYLN